MDVSKNRGKTPKMDGLYMFIMETPTKKIKMDDFGEFSTYFWVDIHFLKGVSTAFPRPIILGCRISAPQQFSQSNSACNDRPWRFLPGRVIS